MYCSEVVQRNIEIESQHLIELQGQQNKQNACRICRYFVMKGCNTR